MTGVDRHYRALFARSWRRRTWAGPGPEPVRALRRALSCRPAPARPRPNALRTIFLPVGDRSMTAPRKRPRQPPCRPPAGLPRRPIRLSDAIARGDGPCRTGAAVRRRCCVACGCPATAGGPVVFRRMGPGADGTKCCAARTAGGKSGLTGLRVTLARWPAPWTPEAAPPTATRPRYVAAALGSAGGGTIARWCPLPTQRTAVSTAALGTEVAWAETAARRSPLAPRRRAPPHLRVRRGLKGSGVTAGVRPSSMSSYGAFQFRCQGSGQAFRVDVPGRPGDALLVGGATDLLSSHQMLEVAGQGRRPGVRPPVPGSTRPPASR